MKKILISAMTVLLLLSAGCEKQPGPDVKSPDETKQAQKRKLKLKMTIPRRLRHRRKTIRLSLCKSLFTIPIKPV